MPGLRVAGVYVVMRIAIIAATLANVPIFSDARFGDFEAARRPLATAWLTWEFVYSVPIALGAGYLAARWGRAAAMRHVLALAGVVLVMGVFAVMLTGGCKPVGHDVITTLVGATGVLAGGFIQTRRSPRERMKV